MDNDLPDNKRLLVILEKLPVDDPQEQLDLMRQAIDIALGMTDAGILGDVEQKLKKKTKMAISKIRKLIAEERRLLQIPLKPEVELPRNALITIKSSDTREYELGDNGILQIDTHASDKGDSVTQEYLWKWDSLKVLMHFTQTSIFGETDRFNFEIDGKVFKGRTIAEFQREVFAEHHLGGVPSIFGTCLSEYIKKSNIPVATFSEVCGFDIDGWHLPPHYHFDFRIGIHAEYYENIEKMMSIEIDPAQARQYMRDLYDAITVKGKDRVFAWGLYSVFAYALRSVIHYMFYLGLLSNVPQTGKTTIAESITCKWWGHTLAAYNKDNFDSPSRVGKYLSGCTFPIVVDDCGELTDQAKGPLKAHATSTTRDQKQTNDHKFAVNKPYQASICFTSQDVPDLYNDTGIAERLFIESMDEPMTPDESENFLRVFNTIPVGYIGKYIIDQTREFRPEHMAAQIYAMENAPSNIGDDELIIDSRTNLMYKIFQYFALLFKDLFQIPLDVSTVPQMIGETRQKPNDELFSLVSMFIKISTHREWDDPESRPKDNLWVQSRVWERDHEGIRCYVIDAVNALDIAKKINQKKLPLTSLHSRLATRWKGCTYANLRTGPRTTKVVFIPKGCIEE